MAGGAQTFGGLAQILPMSWALAFGFGPGAFGVEVPYYTDRMKTPVNEGLVAQPPTRASSPEPVGATA
ncbi:hypothetical protein [Mycolicibacterium lutetiense]|uniref:Uncharacterized protein n=1 Tax=Mycolicibacterium lutetiense TaxID=1641992 RepID=A0ABS5A2M0_9MYCO|nr:hypothetical protein [Mycolicibacterium lutetiense]MBP2455633.1 hypothetical protein [Mycolicibacterium lutetiense]